MPSSFNLTRISICGFPNYACGHTYLLLLGPNISLLAHLKIEVPETLSPTKRLSAPQYWFHFFVTGHLNTTIKGYDNKKEIIEVLQHCHKSSLQTHAEQWRISDEVGEKLAVKLRAQIDGEETIGKFWLYGRQLSFSNHHGNCFDWSDSLLKLAGLPKEGHNVNFDTLIHVFDVCDDNHAEQASLALKHR